MRFLQFVIAISALISITNTTTPARAAPSFDCAKASTIIEKSICANDLLAQLDADLAVAFTAAQKASRVTTAEQRDWLRLRNSECSTGSTAKCLSLRLTKRLSELKALMKSSPLSNKITVISSGLFTISRPATLQWIDANTLALLADREPREFSDSNPVSLFTWRIGEQPVEVLKDWNVDSVPTILSSGDGTGALVLRGRERKYDLYYKFTPSSAQAINAAEFIELFPRWSIELGVDRDVSELSARAEQLADVPKNSRHFILSRDKRTAILWEDPTYSDNGRASNLANWRSRNCWPFSEVEFASAEVRLQCIPYGGWRKALFYPFQTPSRTYVIGTAFNYRSWEPSEFGIYRVFGGGVQNIFPGNFVTVWELSPDGCNVALVHQRAEAETDALAGKSTVGVWNSCETN